MINDSIKTETVAVTVQVLDKEYRIACPIEEHDNLLASAQHLNNTIKGIRDSGKVLGTDRIIVMAALHVAHELLQHQSQKDHITQSVTQRVKVLQNRIDGALHQSHSLDL